MSYYYLTKYSFDVEKTVFGPYDNEEKAWQAMEADAEEEYRIDSEENDWWTEITKNKDAGEITIKNLFEPERTDTTEFILFQI